MNKFSKGIGLIGGILIVFVGCIIAVIAISRFSKSVGSIIESPFQTSTSSVSSYSIKKTSLSLEEVKKVAVELSYDELLRNNENYIGKIVHYKGEVNQAIEGSGNNYYLRIYVTKGEYGLWNDDVFVNYQGKRILENDIIDIWGEVRGIKNYTTVLGASRSIPEIDAFYIEMADSTNKKIKETSVLPETSLESPPQKPVSIETPITNEEIKETPTLLGFSRQKPASIGTPIIVEINNLFDDVKVKITLLDIVRGIEAWNIIKEANMFNDPAKTNYEYILTKVKFKNLESQKKDSAYSLSTYSFTAVSSDGKDYDKDYALGPEPRLNANLYEGASHTGWVVFQIAKDDTQPLMTFNRDYNGTGGVWFKLY